MSGYTKGPWVAHTRPDGSEHGHHVTTADGLTVCSVTYQLPANVDGKVVEVERVANARLISAAPELLEACETLLFELVVGPTCRDEVIANARAAIAKAVGHA